MPTTFLLQLAQNQQAARCMAVCRQCAAVSKRQGLVPFADDSSRQRWMREHDADHPGHQIIPIAGWPSPFVALRRALSTHDEVAA